MDRLCLVFGIARDAVDWAGVRALMTGCIHQIEVYRAECATRYRSRLDRFRGDGRLEAYLHQLARQFARQWIRKARAHEVPGYDPRVVLDCDRDYNDSADFVEIGERSALHLDVGCSLKRLPAKTREVVRLRYFEEYSEQEIAQRLGMTVAAVDKSLVRARQKLKQALADYAPKGS